MNLKITGAGFSCLEQIWKLSQISHMILIHVSILLWFYCWLVVKPSYYLIFTEQQNWERAKLMKVKPYCVVKIHIHIILLSHIFRHFRIVKVEQWIKIWWENRQKKEGLKIRKNTGYQRRGHRDRKSRNSFTGFS